MSPQLNCGSNIWAVGKLRASGLMYDATTKTVGIVETAKTFQNRRPVTCQTGILQNTSCNLLRVCIVTNNRNLDEEVLH